MFARKYATSPALRPRSSSFWLHHLFALRAVELQAVSPALRLVMGEA